MDLKEFMSYAPKDCQPTILDLAKEREKAREEYCRLKGKKLEELTDEEFREASELPMLDDPCDAFRD